MGDNLDSSLSAYLNQVSEQLKTDDLIKLSFEDLAAHIPYYNGEYELDK